MTTTIINRAQAKKVKSEERQSFWIEALFAVALAVVFIGQAIWAITRWGVKTGVRKYQVKKGTYKPELNHAGDYKPTIMLKDVKPIQQQDYVAADRIFTVALSPDVGVVHLRVYLEQKRINRDLVITLGTLKTMLKTRRLTLPDLPIEKGANIDDAIDQTVVEFGQLISKLGEQCTLKRVKPQKPKSEKAQPNAKPVQLAEQPVIAKSPQREKRVERAETEPPKGESVTRYLKPGMSYEGELVSAKNTLHTPTDGRKPYETFEVRIRTNGGTIPVRGIELQREIESKGIKNGQRISILHLGSVPVESFDGKNRIKNMYEVKLLEA